MPQVIYIPELDREMEFPDDTKREVIKQAIKKAIAREAGGEASVAAGYSADGASPPPNVARTTNALPQFGDEAASAASRFGGGVAEQSELVGAVVNPSATIKGLLAAVKASGGDPIRMMAQGIAGEVGAGADRASAAFSRIEPSADISTQRGQAMQTLLAALPVVGPMVEPSRAAIPADPSAPVDAARVAGGVAGAGIDALAARVLPPTAMRGAGMVAARSAERGAVREAGRMNATLGARSKHYAVGRDPVAGALDEGITPRTPVPEVQSRLRRGLDRETAAKTQLLADADVAGVVAGTGTDVGRALNDAFTERMNVSRRAFGPDSAELGHYQRALDNFTDRSRVAQFSATEMQALVDDVGKWIKEVGPKTPVGLALKDFRSNINTQFRKSVTGLEEVNTRIRNRHSAREAVDAQRLKEQAAHLRPGMTGAELLKMLAKIGVTGAVGGAGAKIGFEWFDRR